MAEHRPSLEGNFSTATRNLNPQEREPRPRQELLEISIETDQVIGLLVDCCGQPCVGEIVAGQLFFQTKLLQPGPFRPQGCQMNTGPGTDRIDEGHCVSNRGGLHENFRTRHQAQQAGDHHGHQRECSAILGGCKGLSQPCARHCVMRVVAARRCHKYVDVRRHRPTLRAAPCC